MYSRPNAKAPGFTIERAYDHFIIDKDRQKTTIPQLATLDFY
jgi:hypothetical protein